MLFRSGAAGRREPGAGRRTAACGQQGAPSLCLKPLCLLRRTSARTAGDPGAQSTGEREEGEGLTEPQSGLPRKLAFLELLDT